MKNALLISIISLALPISAFAYTLPAPVHTSDTYKAGAGEVDFSRPSTVQGTFSVDHMSNSQVLVTAGNVKDGEDGYGFMVVEDKLYAITSHSGITSNIGLGFIQMNVPVTVTASYTPNDGIRVDTSSISGTWASYSRGILLNNLPGYFLRGLGALNVSANNAAVEVGAWTYQ